MVHGHRDRASFWEDGSVFEMEEMVTQWVTTLLYNKVSLSYIDLPQKRHANQLWCGLG